MNKEKVELKKSDKRERLEVIALDAAQQCGLKGLSFRTLATQLGVKSSSVHYYFPEKGDLAFALIERYASSFEIALEKLANASDTLRQKLEGFIALFASTAEGGKLCLCGMMAAELDQLDEKSQTLLSQYFETTEYWLESILTEHSDEVLSTLSPKLLAGSLMAGLEGALILDRVSGGSKRLDAQREVAMSWLL